MLANKISSHITSISFKRKLILLCVATGILFLIKEFIDNRSLWYDEAHVASQVLSLNLSEIITAKDNLGYPMGFIVTEKTITQLLGNSEFALRLFPLICGICSIILFPRILGRIADINTTLIGTILFSFFFKLIYYSTEVKPYSLDILISLIVLNMFISFDHKTLSKKSFAQYLLTGCLAILFSHRAILVLCSTGVALCLYFLKTREISRTKALAVLNVCWIAIFLSYYLLILQFFIRSHNVTAAWASVYSPVPPFFSPDFLRWLFFDIYYLLSLPLTFNPFINQLLLLTGLFSLINTAPKRFLMLIAPVFLTVILGFFGYPLYDRLLLFLTPFLVMITAAGIHTITTHPSIKHSRILALFCICLVIYPSLSATITQFKVKYSHEEIKPVLKFITDNIQPSDILYLYYGADLAFQYYSPRYPLEKIRIIKGANHRQDREKYLEDIKEISEYERVWVLFSHIHQDEDLYFIQNIKKYGGKAVTSFQMAPTPQCAPFDGKSFTVLYSFIKNEG